MIPEAEVNFLAPVTQMDKLVCIGLNYSGHCKEQGVSTPETPVVFSKFASNIIGPRDNIMLPPIDLRRKFKSEIFANGSTLSCKESSASFST